MTCKFDRAGKLKSQKKDADVAAELLPAGQQAASSCLPYLQFLIHFALVNIISTLKRYFSFSARQILQGL